ncbi:MAG: sigma-70 family RNA polymerase sigma factor, partial [Myxococcales bacterium]|nr:sigma-70 family RNA polymerase sigma factor [Myxococcales bacterium]
MDVPHQASSESARIAQSARDPPPAFEVVFRRHSAFVWRTLARLGVPDAALDDALQDVFVVVHRRLPTFVPRASIRTWLFEIVRRIAWRHREAGRRHGAHDGHDVHAAPLEGLESPSLTAEAEVERRDALRLLDAWLSELDEDKRCAFIMAELEQLRGPEIASELGVNVNTVYARLRAAREHVQRHARRLAMLEGVGRLREVHRRDRPSTERRRRMMAAVAAKTGTTLAVASAAPAATFGGLGLGLVAAASVLAIVTGVALGVRKDAPTAAPPPASTAHPTKPARSPPPRTRPSPSPSPSP